LLVNEKARKTEWQSQKKPRLRFVLACKGNGFVRVPYRLAKEEITAQCGVCDSEGDIDADKLMALLIDSDGTPQGAVSMIRWF
jgi:hypothetical protein